LGSDITSSLIEAAAADALHAQGACEDMIAVLFPKGRQLPSEELQAAVGAKLHDLIWSIEFALLDGDDATGFSQVWQPMVQSGSLRQKSLLSFVLARVSEERIVAFIVLARPIDWPRQRARGKARPKPAFCGTSGSDVPEIAFCATRANAAELDGLEGGGGPVSRSTPK
jgi:hypothetical protein